MRQRLDVEMVRRGLARSRAQATAMISEGLVLVGGARADKPARLVDAAEPVVVSDPPRFVSRAGGKLEAGLDRFDVDVSGRRCLDAGSSTGGFTDCLLQRGAAEVTSVDVGYGLLDDKVRSDPRVRVLERTNVRDLNPTEVGGRFDVVTADLSFISLRTVAPALAELARSGGDLLALIKPQFEAGPARVGRGGIVRDPAVHRDVLGTVVDALNRHELGARGLIASPVRGSSGNMEFVGHFVKGARSQVDETMIAGVVEAAHAQSTTGRPS